MIIKSGQFYYEGYKGITGVISYSIDKALMKKNYYVLEFTALGNILKYWRRSEGNNKLYELCLYKYKFILNDKNNSEGIKTQEEFEQTHLKPHIAEYFKEYNENRDLYKNDVTTEAYIYTNDDTREFLKIQKLQQDLDFLNVKYNETREKYINKGENAY